MPQLQNNNRVPVKAKDGNAPKSNSYINEVETVNNYNVPSNTAMALGSGLHFLIFKFFKLIYLYVNNYI